MSTEVWIVTGYIGIFIACLIVLAVAVWRACRDAAREEDAEVEALEQIPVMDQIEYLRGEFR